MELIDNKSKLLGDDLKREIKRNAKVRMVASYFSIYAFEALKEELSGIEELQFILAKQQPLYAVFKDKSFATDSVGINNEQLFKMYSPTTVIKVI